MTKIKFKKTFYIQGKSPIKADVEVEFSDEQAADYVKQGYAVSVKKSAVQAPKRAVKRAKK